MNTPARCLSAIAAALLAGCAGSPSMRPAALAPSEVTTVHTEYSAALVCLGGLVDASPRPPLLVHVAPIRDLTVPARYEERRLSRGGAWLVHTAIAKLGSDKVSSTLESPRRSDSRAFVLSGAWTQDDEVTSSQRGLLAGSTARLGLDIGLRGRIDHIAGDFASSHGPRVVHATAVGLSLSRRDGGAELSVDNGERKLAFGFSMVERDAPQQAQRRIVEAAVMAHVARHFQIDYAPCLQAGLGDPAAFMAQRQRVARGLDSEHIIEAQQALQRLGWLQGDADGRWGPASRRALSAFARAEGLPGVERLDPTVFALLMSKQASLGPAGEAGSEPLVGVSPQARLDPAPRAPD
jgi:hypothetical protein